MATQILPPTTHDDLIHDAVLDYYSRRLATCSSDRTIKLFDCSTGDTTSPRLLETLRGHNGPVWSLSWAHPKFGTYLASSSYSGQVLIHKEDKGAWSVAHTSTAHAASVNAVSWAPHEVGAILAAASSDGTVSLVELQNGAFSSIAQFPAHGLGANAVSWAPAQAPGSLTSSAPATQQQQFTKRFVTGGSDGAVKIWEVGNEGVGLFSELGGHRDWVRDVAWSATVLRRWYIASAGEDGIVNIYTSENGCKFAFMIVGSRRSNLGIADWAQTSLPPFGVPAWRVSWSLSGNVLAVSTGDNKVSLWKEKLAGGWENVKNVDEST